ncbi:XisI protein [Pseudanabaena sp. ABRG5-3]|uniref:XisI protein n=1 Tax=Pseudanabaena sp. ABRG5-3 TaxID=685565 RepID=UPI000DC6EE28|nr:XisI protein [Pseudanabaena sp. ABRG5-3]BBC24050.1 fdxN element excision controlling factor protein [Pseudanabaena sp. ABRG5-3]
MDKLEIYQQIIRNVLLPYTKITYANVPVRNIAVFDDEHGQYLIMSDGWDGVRHLHGCLIHIEIIGNHLWVQRDGTEDGITDELVAAGIPKQDIVLGFQEPAVRKYTGYGVA